jgi:hypothetical protein
MSALGQKIGDVTGAVSRKVTRSIGQASSKTLAVAESFDDPRSLDSLSTAVVGVEAGSWLWSRRQSLFGKNTATSPATGGDITVPDWLARGWKNDKDLLSIIHCFSSRLYGLRRYKKEITEIVKADADHQADQPQTQ